MAECSTISTSKRSAQYLWTTSNVYGSLMLRASMLLRKMLAENFNGHCEITIVGVMRSTCTKVTGSIVTMTSKVWQIILVSTRYIPSSLESFSSNFSSHDPVAVALPKATSLCNSRIKGGAMCSPHFERPLHCMYKSLCHELRIESPQGKV